MQRSNGFTLVELAIALMVIGLLIGGVLKGQELIENAKVTSTLRDINAYETATLIFTNTYAALPGDIKKPGSRISGCTEDICHIGGNGNGEVNLDLRNNDTINAAEFHNFFVHMTKAGMLQGPQGGTQEQMDNALSENFFVYGDKEYFFPQTQIGMIFPHWRSAKYKSWYLITTGKFLFRLMDKLSKASITYEDCPAAEPYEANGTQSEHLDEDCAVMISN